MATMDRMQKKGEKPAAILRALQSDRQKNLVNATAGSSKKRSKKKMGPSKSAVYRFLKGETYKRVEEEARGRPVELTKKHLVVLNNVRRKLIKEADNDYIVTWDDVVDDAKKELRAKNMLGKRSPMWTADTVAKHMRTEMGVRSRTPRARISRNQGDEKRRCEELATWNKHPAPWFLNNVHAYIDNKTFVVPRSEKDRKLMRQTRVHHHLRTKEEGSEPGYVVPKKKRMLLGLMTFEVTAAVAKDKIIMWHVNTNKWCGDTAVVMYSALGKVLRKVWGDKRSYRIIEDGDRKGFQSTKGKDAKADQKIVSMTLPPRSPDIMPLDYCLWDEIEDRVCAKTVTGKETVTQYKRRLCNVAKKIPAKTINKCLLQMKKRVAAIIDAKGKHIKMD